jgi:hypothetical protein
MQTLKVVLKQLALGEVRLSFKREFWCCVCIMTPQICRLKLEFLIGVRSHAMLGESLVTTAWRVVRIRMEGSPPGTEGSCEYIE